MSRLRQQREELLDEHDVSKELFLGIMMLMLCLGIMILNATQPVWRVHRYDPVAGDSVVIYTSNGMGTSKDGYSIVRKLDETTQVSNSIDYKFEEKDFRLNMLDDQMASEKLSEGITGFSKAIETLEAQLAHRLAVLEGDAAFTHIVHEIFMLNDLDGDGCITREEWIGSDAVFDALDNDHDG